MAIWVQKQNEKQEKKDCTHVAAHAKDHSFAPRHYLSFTACTALRPKRYKPLTFTAVMANLKMTYTVSPTGKQPNTDSSDLIPA